VAAHHSRIAAEGLDKTSPPVKLVKRLSRRPVTKLGSSQIANLKNIPRELATAKRWLAYNLVSDPKHPEKKPSKRPCLPYAQDADKAQNFRTLQQMIDGWANRASGFQRHVCKEEGFVYVDLDHALDAKTGVTEPWAQKIVDELNSYTEVSLSGTGLHLVCRGTLLEDVRANPTGVEIYSDNGPRNKLMALTGDVRGYCRVINERQAQLETLLRDVQIRAGVAHGQEIAQDELSLANLPDAEWIEQHIRTIGDLPDTPIVWVIDRLLPYGALSMTIGNKGSHKSLLAMLGGNAIAAAPSGPLGGRAWELSGEGMAGTSWIKLAEAQGEGNGRGKVVPANLALAEELARKKKMVRLERSPAPTFLGREIQYGAPVLYIDRENIENIVGRRRLHAGIIGNKNFHYWTDMHKGIRTRTPDQPDDPRIMDWVQENNGYVIYDSLQRWYGNRSEIDGSEMGELMDRFCNVAHAGAGAWVIHHLNAMGERGRGHTIITNTPEMVHKASKDTDNPELCKIVEDRFRCCGTWQLEYKMNWKAGKMDWKGSALDGVERLRIDDIVDLDAEALIARKKQKKEAKDTTPRADKDAADIERIRSYVDLGLSPSTIETRIAETLKDGEKTIGRARISNLMIKMGKG
jgi:hypothetical protein